MLMQTYDPIREQEEQIRSRVQRLSAQRRGEFFRRTEQVIKDPDTYTRLNYAFFAGAHHFYLGDWVRGSVDIVVSLIGLVFLLTAFWVVGLLVFAGLAAVEIRELRRAQHTVAVYNNEVMEQTYQQVYRL